MKRVLLFAALFIGAASLYAADTDGKLCVSNKVVFVDQDKNINAPEVIATVAQQSANETKVLVAAGKAEAAEAAAKETQDVIKDVVANMVKNTVTIYRKGFLTSFAPFVIFEEGKDKVIICGYSPDDRAGHATFEYVATFDCGTLKPFVKFSDSVTVPVSDWEKMADADVSAVVVHNEQRKFGDTTYSKWYSFTIPYSNDHQHFYVVGMDPDTPDGDGVTLNVVNGFTGGYTGTFTDANLRKTYKGGILMEVADTSEE